MAPMKANNSKFFSQSIFHHLCVLGIVDIIAPMSMILSKNEKAVHHNVHNVHTVHEVHKAKGKETVWHAPHVSPKLNVYLTYSNTPQFCIFNF